MSARRVYFAGKISNSGWMPSRHWREWVLGNAPETKHGFYVNEEFEVEPNWIYAGPFFDTDHGSTYSDHGLNGKRGFNDGGDDGMSIPQRSRSQIANADAVLVWLDSPDAYGTILEIGYAAASKKPIYLGLAAGEFADLHGSDLWFVREFATFSGVFTEPQELWALMKQHLCGYKSLPERITRKRRMITLPAPAVSPEDCFVYLIREIPSNRLKIGTTQDLAQRVACLQIGNPDPLEVVAWYPGSFAAEAVLHERWSYFRIHGEWYEPRTDIFEHFYEQFRPVSDSSPMEISETP
jgi:hypothetical protein